MIMEASAVEARGRISPQDQGIWKDEHIQFLSRITASFVSKARRWDSSWRMPEGKPARYVPGTAWRGRSREGGWQPIAPSAEAVPADHPMPAAMTHEEIAAVGAAFVAATRRALAGRLQMIEIHDAHGYLMQNFSRR